MVCNKEERSEEATHLVTECIAPLLVLWCARCRCETRSLDAFRSAFLHDSIREQGLISARHRNVRIILMAARRCLAIIPLRRSRAAAERPSERATSQ